MATRALTLDPLNLDITKLDHVELIIQEIEDWQNLERKRKAFRDHQIATGNQKFYVQDAVREQFPDSWMKFRLGNISLAAEVINKKAKAYKNSPRRELETKTQTQTYEAIFKKGKFNRALKEFDWIFNYYKYALACVSWVPDSDNEDTDSGGVYNLKALKPYEYDLIRDKRTGEPLIFIMSLPDNDITGFVGNNDGDEEIITESQADISAQTELYAMWSKTSHVIVRKTTTTEEDAQGNIIMLERFEVLSVNKGDVNPFAPKLPISFVSKDTSTEYPTGNQLADQSIDFNVGFSNLKTASDVQGHGQLVYKRAHNQKKKTLHMGMFTAIDIPLPKTNDVPQPSVDYINPTPDLAGQLDTLKFEATMILNEHQIRAKSSISGGADKFTSGFDRLLADADCQDVIEDNQSLYSTHLEQDLYQIIKSGEEQLSNNILTSDEVIVKYPKPKVLISDKETISNIDQQKEKGLIFSHEKHMIMDPNLDVKAAKKREKEIQIEREEEATREADLEKKLFPEQIGQKFS